MTTLYWYICAILLHAALAWTNPAVGISLINNARLAPRRRPSCAFFAAATLSVDITTTDDKQVSLNSDDHQDLDDNSHYLDIPQNQDFVDEMTSIFLSPTRHPPGTLSWDVLDKTFTVLNSWSKTGTLEGAQTAHSILQRCLQEELHSNKQNVVDIKHFGMVVEAYSKAGYPQAAEQVLCEMKQAPNRILLNSILTAYARQGNTEQALRVFEQIPSPTQFDYNSLLSAYAKSGNARQAEALLRDMISQQNDMEPDVVAYNCILDAWSKSKEPGAANRALSILSSLKSPDARSYSCVVNALIQEGNTKKALELLQQAKDRGLMDAHLQNARLEIHGVKESNAELAEDILEAMEKDGIATAVSYNTVLKAWKHSRIPDMVERAEALFQRIVARELDDVYSYTNLFACYAKSRSKESAEKAVDLLEQMMDLTKRGRTNVKPNTITVNVVLDALAKSDMASRAESLLNRMEQEQFTDDTLDDVRLNTISYTTVIDGFARSGEEGAAQRAESIFQRMEEACKNGNDDAKPNIQTLNAIMNAWAQSRGPGGPQRAEAILTSIEQAYKEDNDNIRPNVISYTTVMNAWSRSDSPKRLDNMMRIFQRMLQMYESSNEDARPNHVSFANVVDAIVKSGEPGAAQRAQDVIFRMYEEYRNGNEDVKPQARLVVSVMDCYVKSGARGAADKAEALLNWILDVYANEDDIRYRANAVAFNTAINAWAKSRTFGKHQGARSILDKMIHLYEAGTSQARPNEFTFTSVINACAYAVGDNAEKASALQIATATFYELRDSDYGEPNDITYVAYLTAIRNLLPECDEKRYETIAKTFRTCCEQGQVTELVLRRVESSLSVDQLKELYESVAVNVAQPVEIESVPADWRRNVVERQQRKDSRGQRRPR